MKLFDFFGSLATYISIICAHHQNLRAPPKKIRSDKQIIHHHHPNNKNCGIWGRKIKFSDGTRHPSDHLRFCRLLSIKVVLWPLQRKTCRLTERQGRFGFLEKPKTCKLGNPKEKPRGRDIFTGKTGKTPGESSFETRCFFGLFFVGSIGGEGAVLHEDHILVKLLASVCVAVSHCSTKNTSQVVLAAMRQDRSALLYASQELRRDKVGRS